MVRNRSCIPSSAKWAERIGINTYTAVNAILTSKGVEQQTYRSCMGLLKLAEKYSDALLEAMNAHRDTKRQQSREVTFSDLSPQEENQLYTYDKYFADDEAEQSFFIAGKEITAKLLAEALRSLGSSPS